MRQLADWLLVADEKTFLKSMVTDKLTLRSGGVSASEARGLENRIAGEYRNETTVRGAAAFPMTHRYGRRRNASRNSRSGSVRRDISICDFAKT
jgi:hypothetical protein